MCHHVSIVTDVTLGTCVAGLRPHPNPRNTRARAVRAAQAPMFALAANNDETQAERRRKHRMWPRT